MRLKFLIIASLVFHISLFSKDPSSDDAKLSTLYHSLDPSSISKLLAFYELYKGTSYGDLALKQAWNLITIGHEKKDTFSKDVLFLPQMDVQGIISLVNRGSDTQATTLSNQQLELIEKLGSHLKNRSLKGYKAEKASDILNLNSEDIDLTRGLLLWQFEDAPDALMQARQYEAVLDLMALQILAKLPSTPTSKDIVEKINDFIFYEMQFRFPPHSLYAKDIDLYTFLPSVIDSRKGVCLGVSILYLCLAQRLGVQLEIITPPGHIYVRLPLENGQMINIETTARGVHMPTETYFSINTYALKPRTMKEVVGMAFQNQASILLSKDHKEAARLYEKAYLFMPDDALIKMLLGMTYLFTGETSKGKALLKDIQGKCFPGQIYPESIPDDYLKGKTNAKGLEVIFEHVDENRNSILEKQKHLFAVLKEYPHFKAGLFHLAITYLQLGRGQEAIETLKRYQSLDPKDPTVNYYLCVLSMQRFQYEQAWEHFHITDQILKKYDHMPKTLLGLKFHLRQVAPGVGKSY